jgi:hypothetical protein
MPRQLDRQALVDFTRRWFALWTEADPQARSRRVADLWAPAGAQALLDPPQEVWHAAAALAFPVPRLEGRGHDEIYRRVTQAYSVKMSLSGSMSRRTDKRRQLLCSTLCES